MGDQGINDSDPREEKSGISGEQKKLKHEAGDIDVGEGHNSGPNVGEGN